MKHCAVCGNDYDKMIEITYQGRRLAFDSFECAIHALAPRCTACGINVIGHGTEIDDHIFCSAHCARTLGKSGLIDRSPSKLIQENREL